MRRSRDYFGERVARLRHDPALALVGGHFAVIPTEDLAGSGCSVIM